MAASKYKPGDIINGILFLRDSEKYPNNPHRRGVFKCPFCSNEFTIWLDHVRSGNTSSCGCQQHFRDGKHGHNRVGKRTATYTAWACMMARCYNKNHRSFHNYGGRGIKVCDYWHKYENFLKDMGERPKRLSLDRFPDMNGDYEKSNCRWATYTQQMRNTRKTIMVDYKGKLTALKDLTEKFNVDHKRALEKHKKGVPLHDILRGESTLINHSFGVIAA